MRAFLIILCVVGVVGAGGVVTYVAISANPSPQAGASTKTATASIDETEIDFGVFDPDAISKHSFFITNTGDGVLHLSKGGRSCSCTTSKILKPDLTPGDSTEVVVSWQGKKWSGEFWHYATVRTNDPMHAEIKLLVRGQVLAKLAADKQDLDFGSITPGEEPHGVLLVYSHVWNNMQIEEITSSWKDASWRIEPADNEELLRHNAKSGYRVSITGPRVAGSERLHEWMRIKGSPQDDSSEIKELEIEMVGSAKRNFSVYGNHTTRDGVLDFGRIGRGSEFASRSFIKVQGEYKDIQFQVVDVDPPFVKARIKKYNVGGAERLFQLIVTIPDDAPIADHQQANAGKITLASNLPAEPELVLRLDFQIH